MARRDATADEPLILAGDYNVTPSDEDVWDPVKAHGGTHVSEPEREALARLREWGLTDAYRSQEQRGGRFSWWDYRAGMFHRNEGMRIDLLYVTESVAKRVVWAEIDREARKGPPVPSDHAPVVVDLDEQGDAVRCRLGRGTRRGSRLGRSPARARAPPRCGTRRSTDQADGRGARCRGTRTAHGSVATAPTGSRLVADAETPCAGSRGANVGSPPDDGPQRHLG